MQTVRFLPLLAAILIGIVVATPEVHAHKRGRCGS